MRRALRLVPLCLLSFVLAAQLIRALLPVPADGGLAAKLAAWEAVREGVDVLFLGSSRVAHGVAPEAFDAELAARGLPLRSFNLGCDGMGSFETDAVLHEVLADRPERLRYVLVELDSWRPHASASEWMWTAREIRWHDLRLTAEVLRSIRLDESSREEKQRTALTHIEHFLLRLTNLGLLREEVAAGLGSSAPPPGAEPPPTFESLVASRGFEPYAVRDEHGPVFRGDRAVLERALAVASDRPVVTAALTHYNLDALRRQRAAIEEAGLRAIYFVTPGLRLIPFADEIAALGLLDEGLDFHRVELHPELFDPALRYDAGGHLNADGADLFSRRLAAAFLAHVAEAPEVTGR